MSIDQPTAETNDAPPIFDKQPVQSFAWDGSAPRLDGQMVWFRSVDGSEHGWPQLTEHEAMRLALFLYRDAPSVSAEAAQ